MDKILFKVKKIIPLKVFKALQPVYHFILSWLAAVIYNFPSKNIVVVGVTGTTGKTTSVYLIVKTLEAAGFKTGFTSTAIFNDGEREWLNDKKMTMIGRFFTQKMIKRMVENKCKYAIIETTSEGIKQFRHRFINYDILVFTGLYQEHIESHGSFENYRAAKGELFNHLKRCSSKFVNSDKIVCCGFSGLKKIELEKIKKTIIVNLDDEHVDYFLNFWSEQKIGYTANKNLIKKNINNLEIIEYKNVLTSEQGTSFKFNKTKINLQILGSFNVINAMNAICVALSQNIEEEKIKNGIENIKGIAGRLEKIDCGQPFTVIVDYAFEPNAVTKLYETIKLIPHKKIIHVLGSAGGGRDISRRPILGKLAGENSDFVIITNEDPYDEDPEIIIDQVALGAEKAGKKLEENLFKITDRYKAIEYAINLASVKDIVLITGKGSEQAIMTSQGEKITWDDRAVVRSILENKRFS